MEVVSLSVSAAALFVCAGYIAWKRHARRLQRRAHSKDFAFRVAYGWGPEMKLPKLERLKKRLPWISEVELLSWIPELEEAERFLGPLAEEGGPNVLGQNQVEQRIRARFPFLVGEGLRQAIFLVSYGAMHDGYDNQPIRHTNDDA